VVYDEESVVFYRGSEIMCSSLSPLLNVFALGFAVGYLLVTLGILACAFEVLFINHAINAIRRDRPKVE
jgi:hypothetical protein